MLNKTESCNKFKKRYNSNIITSFYILHMFALLIILIFHNIFCNIYWNIEKILKSFFKVRSSLNQSMGLLYWINKLECTILWRAPIKLRPCYKQNDCSFWLKSHWFKILILLSYLRVLKILVQEPANALSYNEYHEIAEDLLLNAAGNERKIFARIIRFWSIKTFCFINYVNCVVILLHQNYLKIMFKIAILTNHVHFLLRPSRRKVIIKVKKSYLF